MPMANPITDNAVNFVTSPAGTPVGAGRQTPVGHMPPSSSKDNVSHYMAGIVIVSVAVLAAMHFLGFRFVVSAGAGIGG